MEKDQNKQDLIDWLMAYAKKRNIVIEHVYVDSNNRPVSFKKHRFVVINMNWQHPSEIPFMIGHEIGHVLFSNHDIDVIDNPTFYDQCSEENPADLFSLRLIYNYSCKKGDDFSDPGLFMQAYGIPMWMAKPAKKLFEESKTKNYMI